MARRHVERSCHSGQRAAQIARLERAARPPRCRRQPGRELALIEIAHSGDPQLREGRPEDRPLLDVHANLFVERSSQKGIVIGHHGARLRDVGTRARAQIEALLGTPVYLDLHVKIAKDWQRDPRQLRKLGF